MADTRTKPLFHDLLLDVMAGVVRSYLASGHSPRHAITLGRLIASGHLSPEQRDETADGLSRLAASLTTDVVMDKEPGWWDQAIRTGTPLYRVVLDEITRQAEILQDGDLDRKTAAVKAIEECLRVLPEMIFEPAVCGQAADELEPLIGIIHSRGVVGRPWMAQIVSDLRKAASAEAAQE